jgi:hypothetical protein
MGTKQYDSATDLITFSRASGGTALSKISYSNDELVTNGTFDTDATGWVGNNSHYSHTIESQRLKVVTGGSGQWNYAQTSVSGLTIGKMYRFQASSFVGTTARHRISLGTYSGQSYDIVNQGLGVNYSQTVDMTFTATTTVVYVSLQNTDGVNGSTTFFDNISVKEVLFDQADGTLQLFNYGNNIPRIEYDATGAVKGLLVEEARTNLVRNSGDVAGTFWAGTMTLGTVTAGSPFGTYQTISPTQNHSNLGTAQRYQIGKTLTSGSTYVGWALVKYSAGSGWFVIRPYDTVNTGQRAYFDLQNGVVGSKDTLIIDHGMVDYGDGWWLCWASSNAASTSGGFVVEMPNGDDVLSCSAADVILIAGSQFEQGAFLTSYIPTTGAAATRAADIAIIPRSSFGHHNEASTWVVEFTPTFPSVDTNQVVLQRYGAGYDFYIWSTSSGTMTASYMNSAASPYSPITANQTSKIAVVLKHGEYLSVCVDGGSVSQNSVLSNTTVHAPPVVGWANVDYQLAGDQLGHIKSIQYYPRRLTDTQLQELTT